MAMTVKNNMNAVHALNVLNNNSLALYKSLQRVSSGQKVVTAKDDSSAYAISEKMRAQIRSLDQDSRNIQNGAALLRIAAGGIENIVDELRNLKTLAIDAANDTNSNHDRAGMQKTFLHKIANINDIASDTNYNTKKLLDGTYSRYIEEVENGGKVGGYTEELPEDYESIFKKVSTPSGNVQTLSAGNQTISANGVYSLASGYTGTITIASGAKNVKITQADSNALTNVQIVGSSGGNANLWIENLNINNSNNESVIKFQGSNNVLTFRGTNTLTSQGELAVINMGNGLQVQGDSSSKLNITGVDGAGIGTDEGQTTTGNLAIVNATIKIDMGDGAAIGSGTDGASVGDITIEHSKLTFTGGTNSAIGSGAYGSSAGDILVVSSHIVNVDSVDTCIGSGYSGSSCGNITVYNSYVESHNSDSPAIGAGDENGTCGDIYISASEINSDSVHGAGVGSGRNATVLGKISIVNATKITHYANPNGSNNPDPKVGDGAAIGSGFGGSVNEITISATSLKLLDASRAYISPNHKVPGIGEGYQGSANSIGDLVLQDAPIPRQDTPLIIHSGATANQSTRFYIEDMHTKSLKGTINNESDKERLRNLSGDEKAAYQKVLKSARDKTLDDIDVLTRDNANIAIRIIEGALEYALNEATNVGSYLQRLDYTDSNVVRMNESIQAAESTIRDADMAKEMTSYTKNNLLLQSAQSMLAQANQSSSDVLGLLQ